MHELITLLAPTITIIVGAIFSQVKRKQYFDNLHITLNSRLDELLRTTKLQYMAKGVLKGRNEVLQESKSVKPKRKKPV